jgi:hypothetical protein
MKRAQIDETDWLPFVNDFSRRHIGNNVTIEVRRPRGSRRCIADHMRLQGISFDTEGTRSASVEISAFDDRGHSVTHIIDKPLYIRRVVDRLAHDVMLEIEPAQGPLTSVVLNEVCRRDVIRKSACIGNRPSILSEERSKGKSEY